MKVHFDEKADAVYLRLDDSPIVDSEEVHPGIVLDFNGANQVVGIEILRVSDHIPGRQPQADSVRRRVIQPSRRPIQDERRAQLIFMRFFAIHA